MLGTNEVVVGRTKQGQCMCPTSLFLAHNDNYKAEIPQQTDSSEGVSFENVSLLYDLT